MGLGERACTSVIIGWFSSTNGPRRMSAAGTSFAAVSSSASSGAYARSSEHENGPAAASIRTGSVAAGGGAAATRGAGAPAKTRVAEKTWLEHTPTARRRERAHARAQTRSLAEHG